MADYISYLPDTDWQQTWPRTLAVLGSTGSIGTSTLDVVRASKGELAPVVLAAGGNIMLLARQASEFRPAYLVIKDKENIGALRTMLPSGYHPTILSGQEGYETAASLPEVSMVVSAQSGAAGLRGTMAAVEAGKVVALANKESLVLAGDMVRKRCLETGAVILPVDSEHNAIFQCLAGNRLSDVRRVVLTASGGPFYGRTAEELENVTVTDALNHPNWHMGSKITIDSATLMNKGLEVIEAHHLFGLPLERIDVLIHRQSIVHSLVEYEDGSYVAQMGAPDMRAAISYCLNWPRRIDAAVPRIDLGAIGTLAFEPCEDGPFPCLGLARKALRDGKGCEVALNAANEVAVAAFLDGAIGFTDIPKIVHTVCEKHMQAESKESLDSVGSILILDALSRWHAEKFIEMGHC